MDKYRKYVENSLLVLATLFLFLIIILGSFSVIIYDDNFYYREYSKNGVYDAISDDKLYALSFATNVTENVIGYLKGKTSLQYFTADESAHMRDVKFVISGINFVYYSSVLFLIAIIIIFYFIHKKDTMNFIDVLSRMLTFSGGVALVFLIGLFLWAVFSFETLFLLMHAVLFPQGNWMFPSNSLLITLFSEQFFFDISLRIFIYASIQGIIFLWIGLWLRKQVKLSRKYKK